MSRQLPCPNPLCSQVFDPVAVAGAASLVCPRCGTHFQFQAQSEATPVADASQASDLVFLPPTNTVLPTSRRRPSRRSRRGPFLVVVVACAIFAGLLTGGLLWYHEPSGNGDGEEANPMPVQSNCRFQMPGDPWKLDEETRAGLRVNLALRRTRPNRVLALYYRDFKTRQPLDAELIEEARRCLGAYFKPLEWEQKPKDAADRLGGQPALKVAFLGRDPSQVEMSGTCYLTAYRGIGYWFFAWAPSGEQEQISLEWDALRQGFTLLDQRQGWKEVPAETDTFSGSDVPYRLTPVKGVWMKVSLDGYDPKADLVLLGRAATGPKHAGTDALVQVLLLPRADDLAAATKAAREHYLQRQKEGEGYPETTLEVYLDKDGMAVDHDTAVGAVAGHLTKLHVSNAENRERYVVLAVVASHPGGVVVLVCECAWSQRERWEPQFAALLKSFSMKEQISR